MKIKQILIAGAAALLLLASGCGRTAVNLDDYVSLETDGLNTKGTASLSVDFEKMVDDNPDAFGLSDDDSDRKKKRSLPPLRNT